jgi:aspartyl-tRNA(Asn)/glutamyl-tRNA(Gln) amidotransferase subunit A
VSWVYYTYPFNLTGQPAASLPVGLSSKGAPVGLQIVTPRNDEEAALKIAAWLEAEIPACRDPSLGNSMSYTNSR